MSLASDREEIVSTPGGTGSDGIEIISTPGGMSSATIHSALSHSDVDEIYESAQKVCVMPFRFMFKSTSRLTMRVLYH